MVRRWTVKSTRAASDRVYRKTVPFVAAAVTAISGRPRRSTAKIRFVTDTAVNAGAIVSAGGPPCLRAFLIVQFTFAVAVTARLVPGRGPPPQSIVVL